MITFSTDTGLKEKDIEITGKLAEKYFKTQNDPNQIKVKEAHSKWILNNIPECLNIIKDDNTVIGFTLILPCNKVIMNQFLNKKINESELFEQIKKSINYDNFDTIYLCSVFIAPKYRKHGLASQAFVKSINKIIQNRKVKPILFYWAYSNEGKKLIHKIADIAKLELRERID
ncbi:GNAT family N-acetyltransferase [Candidatus Pacearchaeota archaeon]|nr:GNAT family N-acetyltransferase [Candidatus Pacearchaeota archaeon]